MLRELKDRNHQRSGLLADTERISRVIFMTMGQRHMSHPLDRVIHFEPGCLESGIAAQEGIDQDARSAGIDAKAGMPKPRNLHSLSSKFGCAGL